MNPRDSCMKPIQKLVPIESIIVPETIQKEVEIVIQIEGWLPDPAWNLKEESIEIDNEKKKIFIKIWGTRDPNIMAAQITKRYLKEIKVEIQTAGIWTIQCNDKNLEIEVE